MEAVFNVFVEPRSDVTTADLELLGPIVADFFPVAEQTVQASFEISGANLSATGPHVMQTGHIFWNVGHDRAVQSRRDGYSFNIVGGYEKWLTHRDEAKRWWHSYAEVVRPVAVKRCGLRYINRIAIPAGREISELLRTYPRFPDELSAAFDEYVMKVVIPFGNERRCVLTQLLPRADGQHGELVLDLDLSADRSLPVDSPGVWEELEALHDLKNRCFFESLTPAALEVYR